ncbi:MAG: hypothetical protein ONB44_21165 [candidate division KSB1 bacterium]|nr:hypothetical protein [candidate division KSB1 bacterium]MDZ7304645.1 hypothetical protein [candidate division KSB1 bacterium]MDZ7313777.1 hypothetical protein [candidate division KSB1 bacterium]
MKSTRSFRFMLAAIFILSSLGCYTLLKHPRVQSGDRLPSSYAEDRISFAENCASCHSVTSLSTYHRAIPPPRRYVSPTWDYYYDYPWWIPYYAPGNADTNVEAAQRKRPFDRRHLSTPDETAPAQTATPAPAPGPTTIAKPADAGTPPNTPQREDTSKRDEKRSGEGQSGDRRTRKPGPP